MRVKDFVQYFLTFDVADKADIWAKQDKIKYISIISGLRVMEFP